MNTIPPNPEEALVTISAPTSDTVRVRDRVESSRFEFYFDGDVEIEEASSSELFFPVDVAAQFTGEWTELTFPMSTGVFVHDHHSGEAIHRVGRENPTIELPAGSYELELIPAPVKIYVLIDSSATIELSGGEIKIREVDDEIVTGVRSPHEHPAGTITTRPDVSDVMEAVSHLGSALKATSAERSWPSLRGQPPNIEVGDTLEIPSSISRHDVDVTIEIPGDLKSVFNVAPLAYYTSANVVPLPSDETDPGVVAAGNRTPLVGALDVAAASFLKRNVLLDTIVRSVGIYPDITSERKTVEPALPWDLDEVYSYPLGKRIAAYQDVPKEAMEEVWPSWPLTIDIEGKIGDVPAIPHVAEELAIVRVLNGERESPNPQPNFVRDFIRADGSGSSSIERTTDQSETSNDIASPPKWSTQLHTSLKPGYPLGSNKTSVRAYERHIDRQAPDTGEIAVNVVCNDDEMREEDIVMEFYGVRDLLEFDVNIHYNLETDDFRSLLSSSFDLIHYIGHVDESGFKCQDGYLDARTDVQEVQFDAFLLNACRSVEQGEALLDAGAIGGIATLYDVPNSSATKLGRTLSRLLNRGFTIRSALEIAREASYLGNRWASLGDGRLSLTQPESGVTALSTVTPREEGFDFELECFETSSHRIGTIIALNTVWRDPYVLPGKIKRRLSEDQLDEFFSLEVAPVKCGDNLYWTDEVSPEELREHYEK